MQESMTDWDTVSLNDETTIGGMDWAEIKVKRREQGFDKVAFNKTLSA